MLAYVYTYCILHFPSAPGQVMNVRAYVYHPILDNDDNITALIVWDTLSAAEAGGIVEYYSVRIRDVENNDIVLVSAYSSIHVLLNYVLQFVVRYLHVHTHAYLYVKLCVHTKV